MPVLRKHPAAALCWLLGLAVIPGCKGRASEPRATQVAAGLDHACALLETGHVECWGLDARGQLGQRKPEASDAAAEGSAPDAGATPDASTTGGATPEGDSDAGADGGATPEGGSDAGVDGGVPPVVLAPAEVEGLDNVQAVSCASGRLDVADQAASFNCALVLGGEVRCWGDGSAGQLGSSSLSGAGYSASPVSVSSVAGARSVTTGATHSCALLDDGSVTCWGLDDAGQLGDPSHPVQGATAVAVGARHSCAVANEGVYCWGDNSVGQLGTPDGNAVQQLGGVVDIRAGGNETCALRADGSVLCWGSLDPTCKGGCGQPPTQVQLSGTATKLAVGPLEACALLDDGSIACWDRTGAPTLVPNVSGAKDLAVGVGFACAVLDDASVACWGDNSAGQLGDGTTAKHAGMVKVQL